MNDGGKRRATLLVLFVFMLGISCMYAKRDVTVYVPIVDALTGNPFQTEMYNPVFHICTAEDSTIVAKSKGLVGNECQGYFHTDNDNGKFLVHAFVDGVADDGAFFPDDTYEDIWLPLDLANFKGNIKRFEPVVLGIRKVNKLQEVTVTASKVMFYNKGDTLVYNADAFVLSSGSMLDALLEQLPGVSLNSDGVIYCNGRKVDNLLLNGKDLFNGDKKLMLSNLAAYTVNDIAVYDKRGHLSEMFETNMGDFSHVMDVRLKREYRNGYIASAEGGYGSRNRYLGRLFGMWFSDFVSLAINAGANNLSDSSVPGKDDGAWSADKMGQGVSERQYGGLNYFASGQNSKWEIQGNMQITHSKDYRNSSVSTKSYLTNGSQFEYAQRNVTNKFFDIKTSHNIFIPFGKRADLSVRPQFSFRHFNIDNAIVDVAMNDSLENFSATLLNAIYQDASKYEQVITRYRNDSKKNGRNIDGSVEMYSNLKLSAPGSTPMALTFRGQAKFSNNIEDVFNRYTIKDKQESSPSYNINRYFRNYPTHNEDYLASVDFSRHMNPGIIHVIYEYSRNNEIKTSEAYMLHMIDGYDGYGYLPSVSEYAPTFSVDDSYRSDVRNNTHRLQVSYRAQYNIGGRYFNVAASVPLFVYDRWIQYAGRGVDCTKKHTTFLPNANLSLKFQTKIKQFFWTIEPLVKFNQRPVGMMDLIEVTNNTDPLNVYISNPNLKNYGELNTTLKLSANKNLIQHKFEAAYIRQYNTVGQSYTFDSETGVRTYRKQNVNGNYAISGQYYFFTTFGRNSRFNISSNTGADYRRSVDFSGVRIINRGGQGNTVPSNPTTSMLASLPLRSVYTTAITEDFKLDWQIARHRISAHAEVRYDKYTSTDRFFLPFDSWTCNAGLSAVFNFPYGWGFSTDASMYMRRGYSDQRLNTTDFVWNARLTKTVLNGSLMFILDGYDLLQQLSNVTYTVNAQARTETVTNAIPSYFLFHIRWTFNKQPKKIIKSNN